LKLSRLSAERTDCGKLFHAFGPAIENALSPSLVLVRGTWWSVLVAERSRRRGLFLRSGYSKFVISSAQILYQKPRRKETPRSTRGLSPAGKAEASSRGLIGLGDRNVGDGRYDSADIDRQM